MAEATLIKAVNDALATEMARDPSVCVLGEDVGRDGGVFRATEGLLRRFGPERVIDTPLNEVGILGMAIGMAMNGLRPVAEIEFSDFIYPAFDQIVSEMAKMRYRSAGQFTAAVVVRAPSGGGIRGGHYHSQSPEAYFIHTAGLVVVMPSTPSDAKGLLASAIRGEDPVIFLEPKALYRTVKGEVAAGGAPRADRERADRPARIGRDAGDVGRDGAGGREGGRDRRVGGDRRRDHRPAHAAAARRRMCGASRACAAPGVRSSCTRRRAPAATAPSWPRCSPSRR